MFIQEEKSISDEKQEEGPSKTQNEPEKDTTFDNLENMENLTQTPPVPPNQEGEQPEQTHHEEQEQPEKQSPVGSETKEVMDEEITLEHPSGEMFDPKKTTSSFEPQASKFTFTPVLIEEELLTTEQEDSFATKKDISTLRSMINVIISGMDLSKFSQQEVTVKKHYENIQEIRKEVLTSISTLQADFSSKVVDVEKKIDEVSKSATTNSELTAKVHAQEVRIKELETQLESKSHDADHK